MIDFAILGGIVSALIVGTWFIGGRPPVPVGAVAVLVAIAALGVFWER